MPTYTYEHADEAACGCRLGAAFEVEQPMKDAALAKCPECGRSVHRIITASFGIGAPKSNADLKSLGFTKLVKRDNGVYENVTATGTESKYVKAGDRSTLPHLKKKIGD
ncbi:MAG TPA: zinc ribbon domain-containing protein [Planctomycetota bacterium]|nr:zinc ribbon domain-containing protein [Planctomycetota bacterium]